MDDKENELITVSKAKDILGLTVQRIGQLIRQGELPAIKVTNRMYLLRKDDVEELKQKREQAKGQTIVRK